MLIKYKIHEVSKDFDINSKDIITLLKDKFEITLSSSKDNPTLHN